MSHIDRRDGFTPRWQPGEGSPSGAVADVLEQQLQSLASRIDRLPERVGPSFFELLATTQLPAQSARAPLVFEMADGNPADQQLPAGTRVAAPPAASLDADSPPRPHIFVTEEAVTLTRARLLSVHAVDPDQDTLADVSAQLQHGFTVFDEMGRNPHELYFGHDSLLELEGQITLYFAFTMGPSPRIFGREDLALVWEYHAEGDWLPLEVAEDLTNGLTLDGVIKVVRACGPRATKTKVAGRESYWVRVRQIAPLPPGAHAAALRAPEVDTMTARVGFRQDRITPDKVMFDAFELDVTKAFRPFGPQPLLERHPTFYVGSSEVFGRHGAKITLTFTNIPGTPSVAGDPEIPSPELAWEYHDGIRWRSLEVGGTRFSDNIVAFTNVEPEQVEVTFRSPDGWDAAEVNGVRAHWIRARMVGGAYGKPFQLIDVPVTGSASMSVSGESGETSGGTYSFSYDSVQVQEATMAAPLFASLTLAFEYRTAPTRPDHCVARNAFSFTDHTDACRSPRRAFSPFRSPDETRPAIDFGFDCPLPPGLCGMFVSVAEDDAIAGPLGASPFTWEYRGPDGWAPLSVLDGTVGFQQSGLVRFLGPPDMVALDGPRGLVYRVRARLGLGATLPVVTVRGVWHNAVWAEERQLIDSEVLGDSVGHPHAVFRTRFFPVLEGEELWVREWRGSGGDWESVTATVADPRDLDVRRTRRDAVREVWVRWHPRPHLHGSRPEDRHYVVERASGLIRFGDDRHGRIPPGEATLAFTYGTGGGVGGNVDPGAVRELHSGVPYVERVFNPIAAAGGAEAERAGNVALRGPERSRNRDRAMTARDYEWIAREASPAVARVRCLPATGPAGRVQRGWITLIVAPADERPRPIPSTQLARRVREYVSRRAPAAVAGRIRVVAATYLPIGVVATVITDEPTRAGEVDRAIRSRLEAFLHPVTGGEDGLGWDFGQSVHRSRIAAVFQATPGVNAASRLELRVGDVVHEDHVPVGSDVLVCSGDHDLRVVLGRCG